MSSLVVYLYYTTVCKFLDFNVPCLLQLNSDIRSSLVLILASHIHKSRDCIVCQCMGQWGKQRKRTRCWVCSGCSICAPLVLGSEWQKKLTGLMYRWFTAGVKSPKYEAIVGFVDRTQIMSLVLMVIFFILHSHFSIARHWTLEHMTL